MEIIIEKIRIVLLYGSYTLFTIYILLGIVEKTLIKFFNK